jgi:hypothetical protein
MSLVSLDTFLSRLLFTGRASGSLLRKGFATGWVVAINLNFDVVNRNTKNAVDRWYNHLLLFILTLLLHLLSILFTNYALLDLAPR